MGRHSWPEPTLSSTDLTGEKVKDWTRRQALTTTVGQPGPAARRRQDRARGGAPVGHAVCIRATGPPWIGYPDCRPEPRRQEE